jgi:hypothetical protein
MMRRLVDLRLLEVVVMGKSQWWRIQGVGEMPRHVVSDWVSVWDLQGKDPQVKILQGTKSHGKSFEAGYVWWGEGAGEGKKRILTAADSAGLEFDATDKHWQIRTSNKLGNCRA